MPANPKPTPMAARMMSYGLRNRDVAFAALVVLVLGVLFVPLPPVLLDLGLAISLTLSFLILMVALWIPRPLDLNAFPTVLLVVTMLRLSLNVASTRLILSEGHTGTGAAGGVIEGFSRFIVSGNFVIGIVIFAILVVINFVVITKGSTRIAEVSARFSLDAMPGKQMAIDADLGAGLIDETEARRRRRELEDESSFYGSMDGASKFVRGDAVAGLIITAINMVGGILIGVLQHGMPLSEATSTYTTLTIGDGLVSQIPALVVSLAAGLIVTKGGAVGAANEAVFAQLSRFPKALYMAAFLLTGVGLLPDFPTFTFLVLAFLTAALGVRMQRAQAREAQEAAAAAAQPKPEDPVSPEEELRDSMLIDALRLDLGAGLVPLINNIDSALPSKIRRMRQMFARDYGFILPTVRLRDDPFLGSNDYAICVQGVPAARAQIRATGMMVVLQPDSPVEVKGERAKDPTFGLDVAWVEPAVGRELESSGLTVVDPESVIITHLTEVIKDHLPDFLTHGATQALLADLDKDYQKLLSDLPGGVMLVQHVLQALLAERVSVRNIRLILEAVSEAARANAPITAVTEHVRRKLSRQICETLADRSGFLSVLTLSHGWENEFNAAVRLDGDASGFLMSPQRVQDFVLEAQQTIQYHAQRDSWPALLVSPELRPHVRAMLERVSPNTPVISHAEVHRKASLRTVGTVGR
ncbi:MAG: flagellar biosynthesis protein FlhA [Gemmobacter sp.]|nr:flagellar biosynthesis protein FlhA [Gemmobacter sp.]